MFKEIWQNQPTNRPTNKLKDGNGLKGSCTSNNNSQMPDSKAFTYVENYNNLKLKNKPP